MRDGAIAAILVIAIIAGAGVGYFVGVNNQRIITTTTTVYEQTSTYSSPVSSSGLRLQVTLNSTEIHYNEGLKAQVALVNTLPMNLTLTPRYSSNSTISGWEADDFLCGNSPYWGEWALEGYALFYGHVSAANLSSVGSPLVLTPPIAIPCVSWPGPSTVVMLPSSSMAVAQFNLSSLRPELRQTVVNASTGSCALNTQGGTVCGNLQGALFGYWDSLAPYLDTRNANTSSPYFHLFPPGKYTLVAEDLWNQTAFAYFQVVPPSGYEGPQKVHSGVNGLGLELTATLPTSLAEGQNLSVTAEVDNTNTRELNLTSTSMVNHANGPCAQGQVTAIDVYSGSYSYLELFNNRSQPTPLLLYNPSLNYLCPAVFNFNYIFQPNSSTATVRAYLGGNQAMKEQEKVVEETSQVAGYWAGSGSSYDFYRFSPGTYTVVVYDYWGNSIIGYFEVR
jgi:hypothetical protein